MSFFLLSALLTCLCFDHQYSRKDQIFFICFGMKSSQLSVPNQPMSNNQIKSLILKKPFSQIIKGTEYTYSIVSKKQKTFVLTNDRFLILKGVEMIGYARGLPQSTTLPFIEENEIPKAKQVYSLSSIQSCTSQNQILKIQFSFQKNALWEMVCPSKNCCLEWKSKIHDAMERLKAFNNSKYQKYEDYVREKNKKAQSSARSHASSSKTVSLSNKNVQLPQENIQNHQQVNKPVEKPFEKIIEKLTEKEKPEQVSPFKQQQPKEAQQSSLKRNESSGYLGGTENSAEKGMSKSKSDLNINSTQAIVVKVPDHSERQFIDKARQVNMFKKNTPSKLQSFQTELFGTNSNIFDSMKYPSPSKLYKEQEKSPNSSPTPITLQKYEPDIVLDYSNLPVEFTKIESILLEPSLSTSKSMLHKSRSNLSLSGRQQIKGSLLPYRRNWIEQLIRGEDDESQLMIDFKRYAKKVVQILVNELHLNNEHRIFHQKEWAHDFASYHLEDVYVEIYFFNQEQIEHKHRRYQKAVKQFKNYDYFLEVTQNQNIVFPPLMAIFEYKGFVGMMKSTVCGQREPFRNRQFFHQFDGQQFEIQSKVSAQFLLNQSKCKIVEYRQHISLSQIQQAQNLYFIQKLDAFLPEQTHQNLTSNRLLRPQLIQSQQLKPYLFGQSQRAISLYELQGIIDKKINIFVGHLQNQEDYFTNSQELTELIHSFGLNVRHLGLIFKRVTQSWLKMIIKAELAARSLKTLFRFDMQNCILGQIQRLNTKEKQSDREIKRAISFLNSVLGSGEATYRIWRGLNNYCIKHYGSSIWEDSFADLNIGYFLQALQHHFKIVLSQQIHQKTFFKSNKTLQEQDFIKFQCDITIYNLDYTQAYEAINGCLEQVSQQNFHQLCSLMVKPTRSNQTYMQLIKKEPIYEQINQYFLNFISPKDNLGLYNQISSSHKPNRFAYQCKLAEIKWLLKQHQLHSLPQLIQYIEHNVKKWLGVNHPIMVRLYRTLAEYFSQIKSTSMKAVGFATKSLEMQLVLYEGECEALWKDYFLLGKINFLYNHYQQALPCLIKSKKLINIEKETSLDLCAELYLSLSKCYKELRMYKQAYLNIRELYTVLKEEENESLAQYMLESVIVIKDLLERNQEYQSYYRFIQTDFSQIVIFFTAKAELLQLTLRNIFFPYLRSILFQKSRNRMKAIGVLQSISKVTQSTFSCTNYLHDRIKQKKFPFIFLQLVRNIDGVVDQIYEHQMIEKWVSFHRMSNDTLLQQIGSQKINRGFELLADLSAMLGLVGGDLVELGILQR